MSVLSFLRPMTIRRIPEDHFFVVHPLDDIAEQQVDTSTLGRMPMTTSVRLSLMALRGYLILMMLLVFYQVMDLGGAFGQQSL
jgi:hypothetical protein